MKNPFEDFLDEKFANAYRNSMDKYEEAARKIEENLRYLKEEHKKEWIEVRQMHEQLRHDTDNYATNLISFMEEVKDMIGESKVEELSKAYLDYMDRNKIDELLGSCNTLLQRCIHVLSSIESCDDYIKNGSTMVYNGIGLGVSLAGVISGVGLCFLGPAGIVAGTSLISASVGGTAATSFGIHEAKKRVAETRKVLSDVRRREKGTKYIQQNLNVIKEKARTHRSMRSLITDADIVINNCRILRGY